jgi:hypothetical protein
LTREEPLMDAFDIAIALALVVWAFFVGLAAGCALMGGRKHGSA